MSKAQRFTMAASCLILVACGDGEAEIVSLGGPDTGGSSEVIEFGGSDTGQPVADAPDTVSTDTSSTDTAPDVGTDSGGGISDVGADIPGAPDASEDTGGGDPGVLCLPCTSPVDCSVGGDFSAHCIVRESGKAFCGQSCSAAAPCPEGYECLLTASMSASAVSQCLPIAPAVCPGDDAPQCDPETCNGVDDDCDGETDEGTCDDANVCTTDQCLGPDGCSHLPEDGGACDDGNACTSGDTCSGGVCSGTGGSCAPGETTTISCGQCGTQQCTCSGACTWENCSACTGEGVCSPGQAETDQQDCGGCGVQSRTRTCTDQCSWGAWSGWGTCSGGGMCTPNETDTQTETCGNCGTRSRTRTCSGSCGWGAWSDWSSCSGQGVCSPGASDSQSTGCGNCGTKSRSRTCTNACSWGSWGSYGSCSGQGVCAPGATKEGCDNCGQQVCSNSCQWGGCTLKPGATCFHEGGSNWECCGSGKWRFCLPPVYGCQWSDQCASCSGCGC